MKTLSVVSLTLLVHSVVSESCTTLTTFNTGLTPHVPEYQTRKEVIPGALLNEGADVLCLQEVWQGADMVDILNVLGSDYPYHYSAIHHDVGQLRDDRMDVTLAEESSACDSVDLAYFSTVVMGCATLQGCSTDLLYTNPSAGLECLTERCAHVLKDDGIRENCLSCLVMSLTTVDQGIDGCTNSNPDRTYNPFNGPGLLLLSKQPITNQKYQKFFDAKMALQRGYIEADVQGLGKVACTHLSAYQGIYYFEYDLNFPNYEMQQRAEFNLVGTNFGGINHIFTGDMNAGPEVAGNDPETDLDGSLAENYDLLVTTYNYQEFYLPQDGRCTWCLHNELTTEPYKFNAVLDHVFIHGNAFSSVTTTRTLDQTDPQTNSYLSDHFGLRASLCQA